MFSLFQGAKVEQKLVLKKYVFVNLFIKFLKEERRVIFLLFFVRHILGCASSPTFLRLSFAYPSLILRSSFAVSISEVRGKWGGIFFFRIDKFAN